MKSIQLVNEQELLDLLKSKLVANTLGVEKLARIADDLCGDIDVRVYIREDRTFTIAPV